MSQQYNEFKADHHSHTTVLGAWRTCNFCGAAQEASNSNAVTHFASCCVPKGKEAIKGELRIINNLAADGDDD